MTAPLSVNTQLDTQVSGNTCLCCPRGERVVYDEANGMHIRREGSVFGNRGQRRRENERTWGELKRSVSQEYNADFPALVQQVTGLSPAEIQQRGKSLKPRQYTQILQKAMAQATPLIDEPAEEPREGSSVRVTRLNIRKEGPNGEVVTANLERVVGTTGDPANDVRAGTSREMVKTIGEAMK